MSDEAEEISSSTSESGLSIEKSWISWFCSARGRGFFVEVEKSWIEDDFNLYGLSHSRMGISHYDVALDTILDRELEYELNEKQAQIVQKYSELLYGLIHARFIVTQRGLEMMKEKFINVDFGRCPRVYCEGQPVLPVGESDVPGTSLKIYCPRCRDIYYPPFSKHSQLDGANFGTTFPHLLLQTYPRLIPPAPKQTFVPRIFGFKIHRSVLVPPEKKPNDLTRSRKTDLDSTRKSEDVSKRSESDLIRSSNGNLDTLEETKPQPSQPQPSITAKSTESMDIN
uniref:Casein kinase II subunit beta n=1 Tax=Arcella intermedia TaxID=1963864 RepID=A0A6B2LDJ1_9EUKA